METRANALLIDDDPHVLHSMKAILHTKRKQWRVHCAEDGQSALRLLDRDQFQLVVSDMRMPGMDGCEVLSEVCKQQPQAVRVLLSGETGRKAPTSMMNLAHQFLCKPCGSGALLGLLDLTTELNRTVPNPLLRQSLAKISTLPANTELQSRIFKELFSDFPCLKTVGKLVHQDMSLSSLMIRVVNSPYFGAANAITNPEYAVCYLGLDIIQGLLLGHSAYSRLQHDSNPLFNVDKLWSHSLRVAQFAKHIASYENLDRNTQNETFTAAMMHDIGKLSLMWVVRDQYAELAACSLTEGRTLCDVEKDIFHCTHAEVGSYMLGLWGFSRNVMRGVLESHKLAPGHHDTVPIGAMVQVADAYDWKHFSGRPEAPSGFIEHDWFREHNWTSKLTEWEKVCRESAF